MKIKSFYILPILCLFLIYGCIEEFEIDNIDSAYKPKTLIEVIYGSHIGWKLNILQTSTPFEVKESTKIPYEKLYLFEGDKIVDSTTFIENKLNYRPQEQKLYSIQVVIQNETIHSAVEVFPSQPSIIDYELKGEFESLIDFELNDIQPFYAFQDVSAEVVDSLFAPSDFPRFLVKSKSEGNFQLIADGRRNTKWLFYNPSSGIIEYIRSYNNAINAEDGFSNPQNVEGNLENVSGVFGFYNVSDTIIIL